VIASLRSPERTTVTRLPARLVLPYPAFREHRFDFERCGRADREQPSRNPDIASIHEGLSLSTRERPGFEH
jgi:hypothetical protein